VPDPHVLDPIEELNRQDLHRLLDRALGYLSKQAREAVQWCYLLELPRQEAALRLGVTTSALEERLRRARRQLYQILNGALRAEAEAYGLLLNPESALGWHETREWCMFCGHSHLRGTFERLADGRLDFRLRCPQCSLHDDADIVNTAGLIPLDDLRSFRPALKRLLRSMRPYYVQAAENGWQQCLECGSRMEVRVLGADELVALKRRHSGLLLVLECFHCGLCCSTALGVAMCWSHPGAQRFMAEHPRWMSEPEVLMEYASQSAICLRLTDLMSAEHFTLLVHRRTLQVLTTIQ
jgi:predicted DNA-binding protein (UPF0251 family)